MKTVAVLASSMYMFKIWVDENKKPNERYRYIDRLDKCYGITFDKIEKYCDWYNLRDIDKILEALESRINRNHVKKHDAVKYENRT